MNNSDCAGFYIGNSVFLRADEVPENVDGFLTECEWELLEWLPCAPLVKDESRLFSSMQVFGGTKKQIIKSLDSLIYKGLITREKGRIAQAGLTWRRQSNEWEACFYTGTRSFTCKSGNKPHQLANLCFFYDPEFEEKPRLWDRALLEKIKELSIKEQCTEEEMASMLKNDDALVWELFDYLSNIQFKSRMKKAVWLTPHQIDLAYKFLIVKKVPLAIVAKGFGLSEKGLLSLIKRTFNIIGGQHGRGLLN